MWLWFLELQDLLYGKINNVWGEDERENGEKLQWRKSNEWQVRVKKIEGLDKCYAMQVSNWIKLNE